MDTNYYISNEEDMSDDDLDQTSKEIEDYINARRKEGDKRILAAIVGEYWTFRIIHEDNSWI